MSLPYYVDLGPRDALVITFVHAFPLNHKMWQPQIALLKDRCRVIVPDLRGFGKTDAGDGQYTLELFVDDLIELLDHLKIQKTVVCGLSMGGYIVLRAVERNPERFRGLVLGDTRSEADSNEAKLKRSAAIKAVKQQGVAAFADDFVKTALAPQTLAVKRNIVTTVKNLAQESSPIGICGALLAMAARTDTTASLMRIDVPTLILVGEHDALTPPAEAKSLQDKIRDAELHVIPDAAHISNLENPQEFNERLLAFLERIR
jgi:3-oxoadipate enol-lactonase